MTHACDKSYAFTVLLTLQLGAHWVPKGTPVHINLWAMHHDERYWQDAEVFQPERWLGDKTGGDKSGGLAYMPFGVGPRMCIAIKLARKCAGFTVYSWHQSCPDGT